jgi:hypothetical protein
MSKPIVFNIEGTTTTRDRTYADYHRIVIEPGNPATMCKILYQVEPFIEDCWSIWRVGMGVCQRGDAYDLETGCRMALKSALRDVSDKKLRRKIWQAYFQRFPVKDRKPVEIESFTISLPVFKSLVRLASMTAAMKMMADQKGPLKA